MERVYEIWMEGYLATGEQARAHRASRGVKAHSFKHACVKHFGDDPCFDAERLTYWGCGLYDNESEARKGFG